MHPGIDPVEAAAFEGGRGPDDPEASFHDLLLTRSREALNPGRRGWLARLSDPTRWVAWLVWLRGLVAEIAIFSGGVALGAGAMIVRGGDGSSDTGEVVVALGVCLIAATILARSLVRLRSKPWTRPVGGWVDWQERLWGR